MILPGSLVVTGTNPSAPLKAEASSGTLGDPTCMEMAPHISETLCLWNLANCVAAWHSSTLLKPQITTSVPSAWEYPAQMREWSPLWHSTKTEHPCAEV